MPKITITGGSDDLIEIGGAIVEEFNVYPQSQEEADEGWLLAFSDGTLLRIVYDHDGIWRVTRLAAGSATLTLIPGDVEADRFDVATLEGDVHWVVLGSEWAKAKIKA